MGTEIARKLATVRKITNLSPIEGADVIEAATVDDGWVVVVGKGVYEVGDLCLFFEIDSFLPLHPEFDQIFKGKYTKVEGLGYGYRLKSIRLKGQISQGLAISLLKVEDGGTTAYFLKSLYELLPGGYDLELFHGQDLTEALGVQKYEKPVPAQLAGVIRSTFPGFIPKTDQERIQNCFGDLITKWIDHTWEVTLKLDGSSMTIFHKDGDVGVCSRNLDLRETDDNAYWKVARSYNLVEKLKTLGRNLAIQGELMGPGVQNNRENLDSLKFYVFDIWDIDQGRYLDTTERQEIVLYMELNHVPIICETLLSPSITVQNILDMADRISINHLIAEGIVFKSYDNPSISFKAINNKYLLKEKD